MKGFKNLTAAQKRKFIIGGFLIIGVFGAYELSRPGVITTEAPPVNAKNLLGTADPHQLGQASINRRLDHLQSDNGSLKSNVDRLQKELNKRQQGGMPQGTPLGTSVDAGSPSDGMDSSSTPSFSPPPVPTVSSNGQVRGGAGGPSTPYGMPGASDAAAAGAPEIQTWGDDSGTKSHGGGMTPAPAVAVPADGSAKAHDPKAPKVFIPAGTMLTGVLLTGVDAPTGRDSSAHPVPVLVRVKEDAILPNEYRADYRECFIVASAMGDLSSERSYMRGETLSCVSTSGGVIQSHLQMWGTGEDGKAGMRGTLVSKQGSILAKALLAGFASGVGRAFTPQQTSNITMGGSGYQTLPMATAGRMAAMSGVSSAADQIAQFYLQMADATFPVIEISAGRPVTFIVEKGAELSKLETSK